VPDGSWPLRVLNILNLKTLSVIFKRVVSIYYNFNVRYCRKVLWRFGNKLQNPSVHVCNITGLWKAVWIELERQPFKVGGTRSGLVCNGGFTRLLYFDNLLMLGLSYLFKAGYVFVGVAVVVAQSPYRFNTGKNVWLCYIVLLLCVTVIGWGLDLMIRSDRKCPQLQTKALEVSNPPSFFFFLVHLYSTW